MATRTAAQEEFDSILTKSTKTTHHSHPADSEDYAHDHDTGDVDEDEAYTQSHIDDSMRAPTLNGNLRLPPREFDLGRTTGVKGVIADARSYQEATARRGMWYSGGKLAVMGGGEGMDEEGGGSDDDDEDGFLERWRRERRVELQQQQQLKGAEVRTRRTSPSLRRWGRFDEVDALGYLDAIEKVARDTVVVVFVYDAECEVSQLISKALSPLVPKHSTVHFVRVPYEDIEFDNAGVPAILAYKNQGDLFANLTYVVDQLPTDASVDSRALESVLQRHQVL